LRAFLVLNMYIVYNLHLQQLRIRLHISLFIFAMTVMYQNIATSQDVVFSQFYNAPIQLNAALAGLTENPHVSVITRDQWTGWGSQQNPNGGYRTFAASYDQFFRYANSGIGVQVLSDNAGDGIITSNQITGVYAYQLRLNNKFKARIGLEATLAQQRLDWDQLIFFDQIIVGSESLLTSQEIRPDVLTTTYFDFGVGGVLYSDEFYVGLSLKHLNVPDNSFQPSSRAIYAGLPPRLTIHAGWQIDLDGYNNEGFGSFFAPSVLLVRQSELSQLNAGGLINRENFFAGAWIRYDFSNFDAVILSAGWRTDWLKLTYSFDVTLSAANVLNTRGSHEVSVVMNFGAFGNPPSRYEDCFSIFR